MDTRETPRLSAIKLIYTREMRDQLRDRRTIFTIAVLPLLVYPLVGMLLLQMAQFTRQQPISVCLIGEENLKDAPPLFDGKRLNEKLIEDPSTVEVITRSAEAIREKGELSEKCEQWLHDGVFDAIVIVPEGVGKANVGDDSSADGDQESENVTSPHDVQLMFSLASDQSRVAGERVKHVLRVWRERWIEKRLGSAGVDVELLKPFNIQPLDISPESTRRAAFWSKLLPFVMLVWAMTGAFYPAIDLVAGEKERGTLETLLCSPALRGEIVWGKLLAVSTFSVMTSLLNVISMQVTAGLAFQQIGLGGEGGMGPPPLSAMLWLLLALFPLAGMFSALALAVAAMARSSKEGQYYLMPLMMVTLPLVMLPLLPGTTLNLGTSLIPVTGMFLLVRSLVENQYTEALLHLPVVVIVTFGCLHMAVRWAQSQFESEEVLFRDGEQWDLSCWMRHLWRDRQPVATVGQGMICACVVSIAMFFGKLMASEAPTDWGGLVSAVLLPQIGLILAPTLLMATMLTTSIRQSLRIRFPERGAMAAALLLGFTLQPMYHQLAQWITALYPISEAAQAAMKPFETLMASQSIWSAILVLALVPAVCEELTCRGFVFGGLARGRRGVRAIVVTALMFGLLHGVLQQSIAATFMGCILGWIAWKTGSVLPCIILHATNNSLAVALGRVKYHPEQYDSWLGYFVQRVGEGDMTYTTYTPVWTVVSASIAVACVMYFSLFNSQGADDEEAEQSEQEWLEERAQEQGSDAGNVDSKESVEGKVLA